MPSSNLPERDLSDLEIELAANSMRRNIITMLEKSKSGHPGGSLSSADIVANTITTTPKITRKIGSFSPKDTLRPWFMRHITCWDGCMTTI